MTELSSDAQAMLELARRTDRPRAGDRERVAAALAGMGVGAAAVAVGPSAAAAAGSAAIGATGAAQLGGGAAALGAVLGKVVIPGLVGLALGAAVATPIALYETAPPASNETQVAATEQVARVAARPDPRQASGAAPKSVLESPAPVARSRSARSVSSRGAPPSVPSSKPAANLQAEAELLARASSAIGSGRAAQALELLDRHERDYADGALAEERGAARVLALCEAGRTDEARRLGEQFLRSAPRSPLVPRVRASCAFGAARASFDSETETSTTGHNGGEQAR